jgi:DNA-binding MarR family transcriptional regulator
VAGADRRARVFSLSDEGARLVEEKLREFRDDLAEALVGCTDAELAAASELLDRLARMFERR